MQRDHIELVREEMLNYGASPEVFEYLDENLTDIAARLVHAGTRSEIPVRLARLSESTSTP